MDEKNQRKILSRTNKTTILRDVTIAVAIALVISIFFRPTLVKETSMEPTIHPNDYLVMSKQAYSFGPIKRGDVVVFKSPGKTRADGTRLLIKRVIALENDVITISDGNVYLNGSKLQEEYLKSQETPGEIYNLAIPKGKIYVMGDNRKVSMDSRKMGAIGSDTVVGKAVLRLLPLSKIGKI